jgi:TonB-linked SusC/RagA family outer membrane protein
MRAFLQTAGVVLCTTSLAFAQQRAVQGVVTDSKGEPLPGATVLVKGTTVGSTTGPDGNFQIAMPAGSTTLVVSFVGSKSQEVVVGSQTTVRVALESAAQSLDDVVVVGYGTARKSDLTGAVASVTGAQLTQVATSDAVQSLQGRVAGVDVTSNSGQPGSGTRIRVRGVGTINNSDPLYVVDGIQTADISFLLPVDIESTEILKDASATAIYGSRGANGVVLITTKHGKEGKVQFNLFGYTGFQQIRRTLPLANAQQYATLVTEAYANAGSPIPSDYSAILAGALQPGAGAGTDYQKFVTQKGLITNYSLTASGGNEQNHYLVSGRMVLSRRRA